MARYRLHCIGASGNSYKLALYMNCAGHAFMLGDRPTLVDFSLAGYVYYPKAETGFDIAADYPALDAWRQRLADLPGWKPPYDMMPVGSDLRTATRRPV